MNHVVPLATLWLSPMVERATVGLGELFSVSADLNKNSFEPSVQIIDRFLGCACRVKIFKIRSRIDMILSFGYLECKVCIVFGFALSSRVLSIRLAS